MLNPTDNVFPRSERAASFPSRLRAIIFYAAVALMAFASVPNGSVEPWWRGVFASVVFLLAAASFVEFFLAADANPSRYALVFPLIALALFALIQTIPFGTTYSLALARTLPRTISADAHTTRRWAVELLGLAALAAILLRYGRSERRFKTIVYAIVAVSLTSAIFGLVRQTMQHQLGFGLPYLRPGIGYAQFINKNHFAFMAEIGFGLTLGLIVWRGLARERLVILVGFLLVIGGTAVLANSRGGMLAMLSQVLFAGVLRSVVSPAGHGEHTKGSESIRRLFTSRLLRAAMLVALVSVLFGGVIWIGSTPLITSLEAVPSEIGTPADSSRWAVRRWDIWPATLHLIKDHLIAGVGFGGYWMAITQYHKGSGEMVPQEAHNDYLEFLASGGLIGFAIGAWFVVVFIRRARRRLAERNRGRFARAARVGAILALAGIAVHSSVDFGLHVPANAAAFIALLVISTIDLPESRKSAEHVSRNSR